MSNGEELSLLPCPFCGGEAYLRQWANAARVECPNTDCFGPITSAYGNNSDAIAAWNRRSSPSSAVEAAEVVVWTLANNLKAVRNTGTAKHIGVEAARAAIKYLSHPETPWSDDQVGAVISAYLASLPQPEGETAERTLSGETIYGIPVAAYMEENEFGGNFAAHWSTLREHRNPVRLFREADVASLSQRLAAQAFEIEMLTRGGIIEVAVRNPSVADYMKHWEGRAEAAEARLAHAREAAIEECAKVADACRMDIERNPHDFGNLDAGGIRASDKIAAAIRALSGKPTP